MLGKKHDMKPNNIIGALFTLSILSACQNTNSVAIEHVEPINIKKTKYEEYVSSGQQLPIQSIIDIDGNKMELHQGDSKKLVILFATWCSDSNRALKALNESELLNDADIEIIAIAREETLETVKQWRDQNNIKVPLAVDPDRAIFKRFAAAGIPRMVTVYGGKIIAMNLAEGDNQLEKIVW